MKAGNALTGQILSFPDVRRSNKHRKTGLNNNRDGSVRNINGKIYVDFIYLGERVREFSGYEWNDKNAKLVRVQLDKIVMAIESGTFRFVEVFPRSKKKDCFREKENQAFGFKKTPDLVLFEDYAWTWYETLKLSGRVSQRTLFGYKNYLNNYLIPFFGKKSFADFDLSTFEKFILWSKKQLLKGKVVGNETINKVFIPLKTICKSAAGEFKWPEYNPFFGFKKLPEHDPYEKIMPFSVMEQRQLIAALPDPWKPFFSFAFCSGLRQGEQIGLKPEDIDWEKSVLKVQRAITLDEDGKRMEGPTKNKFSRRTIRLTPLMCEALKQQKIIYDRFSGEFFFCSPEGQMIHPPNLRRRVWIPALQKAGLVIREMKQTRHSFATVALSCGENPLWIANVMGHRDTNMIIKVYGKYVANTNGSQDGSMIEKAYQVMLTDNE